MKIAFKDPAYQRQVKAAVVDTISHAEPVFFIDSRGHVLKINCLYQ